MHRTAACFCIILLVVSTMSALPFNTVAVKTSVSPTTIPEATLIAARPVPVSCGGGAVNCNGMCTDTDTDEMNCGTCGMTCSDPAVCCGGECVDLQSDNTNCGSCGMTCFAPAACCSGSCEDTCFAPAAVGTPRAVFTTGPPVAASQGRPAVQVVSRVNDSLTSTPHTPVALPYRNMTSATPAPQACPSSEWACLPLAQAAEQFGHPYAQYGNAPCGYTINKSQTVPEYCCRAVPEGSIAPASPAVAGSPKTDPLLHIINRTRLNTANESGTAGVYGSITTPRPDFISTIIGFFGGLFTPPVNCGENAVNCNGVCTDMDTDEMNCGTCGMTCFDPAVCCNGECVDLQSDNANCGFCGMTCFEPAACCYGSCEDTCSVTVALETPGPLGLLATPEPLELATPGPLGLATP